MKLGLLTAAFPRLSLEQVAAWAAGNGFEMLEVACWPAVGGERRRYAGVCHIDVAQLDVQSVRDVLDRHGLEISSLAYYPNNLHPDPRERRPRTTISSASSSRRTSWASRSWARSWAGTATRASLTASGTSGGSGRGSWRTPRTAASRSPSRTAR